MKEITEKLRKADLDFLAQRAYENAMWHGFHDEKKPTSHWLCLVICELSEAVEADRKGRRANIEAFDRAMKEPVSPHEAATQGEIYDYWFEAYIKDTLEDELADTAIRLLDLAGSPEGCKLNPLFEDCFGIKWKPFFVSVPGQSFTEKIYMLMESVFNVNYINSYLTIGTVLYKLCDLAMYLGFDLLWYIEKKMTYNEHRPFKHGKEY